MDYDIVLKIWNQVSFMIHCIYNWVGGWGAYVIIEGESESSSSTLIKFESLL